MNNKVIARHVLGKIVGQDVVSEVVGNCLVSEIEDTTRFDPIETFEDEAFDEAYDRIITGQMISDGYCLVTHKHGFEVINIKDGTNYCLSTSECCCGSVYSRCKHISFLTHHLKLRTISAGLKNV